jgi:hypothetical protein
VVGGRGASPARWTPTGPLPVRPEDMAYLSYSLNGAGASVDMNVDGTTPKSFRTVAPAARRLAVHRVIMHMADVNIEFDKFAGLGAVLTNGIGVSIRDADDVELLDFMGGDPLVRTVDWSRLAGPDIGLIQTGIGGDPDVLIMRWSLYRTGVIPILEPGEYMEFLIQDNLTGLSNFKATVHGWYL